MWNSNDGGGGGGDVVAMTDRHTVVELCSSAYPVFRIDETASWTYDLVVHFGSLWKKLDSEEAPSLQELMEVKTDIEERCVKCPNEVSWVDACGDTALHRLCQAARLPSSSDPKVLGYATLLVDIAKALVAANPSSTTTRACNNWDETPLHQFACHCGFPRGFPSAVPYCDDQDALKALSEKPNPMLHLARILSEGGACSKQNCWGSLPLHDACGLTGVEHRVHYQRDILRPNMLAEFMKEQHAKILEHLIENHPNSLTTADTYIRLTPLQRAFRDLKCGPASMELLLCRTPGVVDPTIATDLCNHYRIWDRYCHLGSCEAPQQMMAILEDLWPITVLLLKRLYPQHQQSFRLLHAAASFPLGNEHMVRLAAMLHPEQVLECDSGGCTPLALSLNRRPCDANWPSQHALLAQEMHSATVKDGQGRLPFHTAIAAGGQWKKGCILPELFVAKPDAIASPDPVTGLFPFSLAATDAAGTLTDNATTIFELLRKNPSVLA